MAEYYASVSKAEQELGWTAKRDIIDMCGDAWRFEGARKGVGIIVI
jgi:UDP-glucose 4-epimerase